jgi:hypothetical protein
MDSNMQRKDFQVTEITRRNQANQRRETEMGRTEAIQFEMASAVRLIGGSGNAKEQINAAARAARLPHTVIERLRWRKVKRIPADIADAIREAVHRHNEEGLARAQHDQQVLRVRLARLEAALASIDPDFHGPQMAAHRSASGGLGGSDLPGTD